MDNLRDEINEILIPLQESLHRLENELYSEQWRRVDAFSEQEFSPSARDRIRELARIIVAKNPLVNRGVSLVTLYTWAQGVKVVSKDEGVQAVIDSLMKSENNKRSFFGGMARSEIDQHIQEQGELFLLLFPNEGTGKIKLVEVNADQINDIIYNPDNATEPWLYIRQFTKRNIDGSMIPMVLCYPDIHYTPTDTEKARIESSVSKLSTSSSIKWSTPIYHIATNPGPNSKRGIAEFYSGMSWATAYTRFLEDLSTVWAALARFAFKLTVDSKTALTAAKSLLGTSQTLTSGETNPPPIAGGIFGQMKNTDLEPVKTGGATMKADDGRRIFLQVASSFGFPETFWGDSTAGSLATAKSLDRPTQLKITNRQNIYTEIYEVLINYALLWSAKAPAGIMSQNAIRATTEHEQIVYSVDFQDYSILWPPIIEEEINEKTSAIIDAITLKGQEPVFGADVQDLFVLLLSTLGIENAEDKLSGILDFNSKADVNEAFKIMDRYRVE